MIFIFFCVGNTEEEMEDVNHLTVRPALKLEEADFSAFSEISSVNLSLLDKDIPCIIIAVNKNRVGHVRELHQQVCQSVSGMELVKMVLYVEHTVDPKNLPVALWRFCNNLDPKRDQQLFSMPSRSEKGKNFNCLGLDGTIKTKEFDNFQRDWPNIIVAADETIEAVDNKWGSLGLGLFIPSPSLSFKEQVYGNEAIVQ